MLNRNIDDVNMAIQRKTRVSIHLGGGVVLEKRADSFYIDIRQWWLPIDAVEPKPTRKGICLRPDQWAIFIANAWRVDTIMCTDMKNEIACFDTHDNQMGYWDCDECRPFRRLDNGNQSPI